jgi:hypothetical protein
VAECLPPFDRHRSVGNEPKNPATDCASFGFFRGPKVSEPLPERDEAISHYMILGLLCADSADSWVHI